MDQPRFRFRWWHWLIATVIVIVLGSLTTGMVLRSQGRSAWATYLAEERAAGRPGTVDAWIDGLPPVDSATQEAWHTWSQATANSWTDPKYDGAVWDRWLLGLGERPQWPAHEIQRAQMAPACVLLRGGTLILSARGWLAADCPPGKRRLSDTASCRLPNLLTCRSLAEWLRHEAGLASDPGQSLADLDALMKSMQAPGCLIDAMIALACDDIRARTYFELALTGRLSASAREAWLAEPQMALRLAADGFSGEGTLFAAAGATWMDSLGPFTYDEIMRGTAYQLNALTGPVIWATGHRDFALIARSEAHVAARLRGERSDALPIATVVEQMGLLARLTLPNVLECQATALMHDAQQRAARLAVRLLALPTLPADQAALLTSLDASVLAPAGDHLALRYERLADDRFRLVVDPASPVPNLIEPRDLARWTKAAGTPADAKPIVWGRALIELQRPVR